MGKDEELTLREVFGAQVRCWRTERKLTQTELAEAADISLDMVSRLERGVVGPSLDTVAELAKALNVSPAILFGGLPLDPTGFGEREIPLQRIHHLLSGVETKDLPWIEKILRSTLIR